MSRSPAAEPIAGLKLYSLILWCVLFSSDLWAQTRPEVTVGPGIVFLGCRSLAADCRIEPVGAWEQFNSITVNCVIGMGLFQGLEYVLSRSPLELISKTGVAWSRMRVARKLFARSEVYHLTLRRDLALNAETIRTFIRDKFPDE